MKETEILMALQAVLCHVSSRTMEMFVQMSKVYFLDSDILDKLQLRWTIIGYLVQFGLAPYFRVEIFSFTPWSWFSSKVLIKHLIEYLNESKWMLMWYFLIATNGRLLDLSLGLISLAMLALRIICILKRSS